jgi:acyl-CoA synthetase (AMP-forming)/AMP-acid ligase II
MNTHTLTISNPARGEKMLYTLSTGASITSLVTHENPLDEYRTAFTDRARPFLYFYAFEGDSICTQLFTRGQFWDLAAMGAAYLIEKGLSKGDRVVHGFSNNSPYDLIFRLSAVMTGGVPVTINWQADDKDRLIYKATVTGAKIFLYDHGFTERAEAIRSDLPDMIFFNAEALNAYRPAAPWTSPRLHYDDEKMIIFTAGTTGLPKGVKLPHRSYLANRLTFEEYFRLPASAPLDILLVNPLHHTNSSALSDWGMRRTGASVHLTQHYSTPYWKILTDTAHMKQGFFVAPLVPRHIDFLVNLIETGRLPLELDHLRNALQKTDILIGSAPVGPTTVTRILKLSGRYPRVRFGSTEACLQVTGTPTSMTDEETREAFEAGWNHEYKGDKIVGYYIGREHYPFTRIKIVKKVDPGAPGFMEPCEIGEPGYLINQGANIMSGYVAQNKASRAVFRKEWYTGLRDIGFALRGRDGCLDYYWMTRDSALLIRGGANYSYEQIASDLSRILAEDFKMKPEQFKLAVVGICLENEHEDNCCVTIELSEEAAHMQSTLKEQFIARASGRVSKGSRPDYVRFAKIPVSFKGAVLFPQLKREFSEALKTKVKNK